MKLKTVQKIMASSANMFSIILYNNKRGLAEAWVVKWISYICYDSVQTLYFYLQE